MLWCSGEQELPRTPAVQLPGASYKRPRTRNGSAAASTLHTCEQQHFHQYHQIMSWPTSRSRPWSGSTQSSAYDQEIEAFQQRATCNALPWRSSPNCGVTKHDASRLIHYDVSMGICRMLFQSRAPCGLIFPRSVFPVPPWRHLDIRQMSQCLLSDGKLSRKSGRAQPLGVAQMYLL